MRQHRTSTTRHETWMKPRSSEHIQNSNIGGMPKTLNSSLVGKACVRLPDFEPSWLSPVNWETVKYAK